MLHMVQFLIHAKGNTIGYGPTEQLRHNVIWYSTVTTRTVQRAILYGTTEQLETMQFVQYYIYKVQFRSNAILYSFTCAAQLAILYSTVCTTVQFRENANCFTCSRKQAVLQLLHFVISLDKEQAFLCSDCQIYM